MITIPTAVHNAHFRWQLGLFWFAHRWLYGDQAASKIRAVVIKRNRSNDSKAERMEWSTSVPHSMCESYFDLQWAADHRLSVPLNIQAGLEQVLPSFPDDQLLEVTDCDMLHFRPHPAMGVSENQLLVTDVYEAWHLRSLTDNRHVIAPYLANESRYYNGGFVPLIGHARTFRRIMRRWIDVHLDILKRPYDVNTHWWAGMFALQAACENAGVEMVAKDYCYVPGPHASEVTDAQYIGHYCVDSAFDKRRYPLVDESTFPDNPYYAMIKKWLRSGDIDGEGVRHQM